MKNINKYVEHTLLKQDATKNDLDKLLAEAQKYNFLGVCVNPINVRYAKETLKNTEIKIVTVIGFPLGANKTEIKMQEAVLAVKKVVRVEGYPLIYNGSQLQFKITDVEPVMSYNEEDLILKYR